MKRTHGTASLDATALIGMKAKLGMALFCLPLLATAAVATPISYSGGTYTQDFNTLANTGTSTTVPAGFEYFQNGALGPSSNPNGTATGADYTASPGNSGSQDVYSFGAVGSTERAFGDLVNSTSGPARYGFGFTNNSGQTITQLTIGYTGEQWRQVANTTAAANTLLFDYRVGSAATDNILGTGFTRVTALDFTSPQSGALGTGVALDGNAAANRTVIAPVTISGLNIINGETFFVRFNDPDDANINDQAVAIDDFSLSTNVQPVPEPGTTALMLCGLAAMGAKMRRRKNAGQTKISNAVAAA